MDPEEHNFEALRRLLALKRHEQPPPGYFQSFSQKVITRIQAEDNRKISFLERWFGRQEWLEPFRGVLEGQPVLAGAVGLIACGLLLGGALLSDNGQNSASELPLNGALLSSTVTPVTFHQGGVRLDNYSRTNGLMLRQLHSSLFPERRHPDAQLSSFTSSAF